MRKLLLHIGYPKTATTTLQHNVFYKLHLDGSINFIGKYDNRKYSKIIDDFYYPVYDILLQLERLNDEEFERNKLSISTELDKLIVHDKINVWSNEEFLAVDPLKDRYFVKMIDRLYKITKDIYLDIDFILFLRNHPDLIFSYYVERYGVSFCKQKKYSTFNNFLNQLKLDHELYYSFNFEFIVNKIKNNFPKSNVYIFFYEDLISQSQKVSFFFETTLRLSCNTFYSLFNKNIKNIKDSKKSFKYTDKVYRSSKIIYMVGHFILKYNHISKFVHSKYVRLVLLYIIKLSGLFGKKSYAIEILNESQRKYILDLYNNDISVFNQNSKN